MSTFFQWIIDSLRDIKFWFRVEPWEKGVRVRAWFGRSTSTIAGPGLHLKYPFADEIYLVNTRLRLAPATSQTVITKDKHVVTLGINLGFSIIDPLQAMETYHDPEGSMNVLCHNFSVDYIRSKTLEEIDLNEIENSIEEGLRSTDSNNGINIEFVKITNFVPSGPAASLRVIQNDIITDHSSSPDTRTKWQPNVTQW